MDFAALPPEVNSGLMYAGPGAGPMLAAAAAWSAVGAELESAASGYYAVLAGLVGQVWSGPTSLLMAAAATPFAQWLAATGMLAGQTATQAYAAAAAYEAAFAATVPPPVIAANRAQLAALVTTNFFGQNTAAIMATEAQYMEMWAQDATAMYAYQAASQTASTLTPFTDPPQITNPTGQTSQAQAVAQASTNTTQQPSTTTGGVDPPLPQGSSANIANGGANVDVGVTVTVTDGYPVSVNGGIPSPEIHTVTAISYTVGSVTLHAPANTTVSFGGNVSIVSGTFTFTASQGGPGSLVIPSGSVTGATGGAMVTENASGLVTAINSGAVITGATVTPTPVPVTPTASGGLVAAVIGSSSSPGLAGAAGIEPQLNAPLLAEWARGLSGAELAADLAGAPGRA